MRHHTALLLVTAIMLPAVSANAQAVSTPTFEAVATPTGTQAPDLCSGGPQDGLQCAVQSDCPSGVCVVAQGVCDDADGFPCDCAGGTCSDSTCNGGASSGGLCDPTSNCAPGVSCVGTQKVCVGNGTANANTLPSGFSCLVDQQCRSGQCRSTGLLCGPGVAFTGFACAQDADCCITGGPPCPSGICSSAVPSATPTVEVPPSTPTPIDCIGDCNGDGQVTVDEIVTSVAVALSGSTTLCPAFDCCPGCDGGQGGILVDCLITTVNNALNGCLVWRPGCSPPFPVVGGGNPCPPSVTICTTDQVLGRSCDALGASCCPSDSLCTGGFCNAGLVCDIRPSTRCPVLREVESP